MENISWKLIDKYFTENPNNLVAHHLESYNDFFENGINRIFRENNPIRFIEREDDEQKSGLRNECLLYLGGKDGTKIYFGKPIIYDDHHSHYMYPNDARLRNMTYGTTIHYDVDVEFIYYEGDEKKEKKVIEKDKKCEKCNYLTDNKYQLQQHYLNYHATKEEREKEFKYYCKCCDYGTYSKDFIEKHNNTNKHKLQSNL
jgi:DNA-directed RNA polymerase beta subunit